MADVAPVRFLALRFALGAFLLLALALRTWRRPAGGLRDRRTWRHGAILGLVLYVSYLTQTVALVWISPATSAFLTAVSVVLVPVLGWLGFRDRVSLWTWAGVTLAFAGLVALSLRGSLRFGLGECVTLVTAMGFACHIVLTGFFARQSETLALTAAQVSVLATLSLLTLPLDRWLATHGATGAPASGLLAPLPVHAWAAVATMGVFASAATFLLQTYAQRRVPSTRVGVLFTLEPVFATLFSFALLGERPGPRAALGMVLILAGMLTVETLGRRPAGTA